LSNQPSINKGTLILLEPNALDPSISSKNIYFVFQYNPEKLVHTFNQGIPSALAASSTNSVAPLIELYNLTFELDSVEGYSDSKNQSSTDLGLHPALAMLELMMQPQKVGTQATLPIVLFKWGAKRSVAVRIVSMNVEEKSFDPILNPTRASVSLTLRILEETEIANNPAAKNICIMHNNVQTTLVDAYKSQTGQTSVQAGSALSVSDSANKVLRVKRKTKTGV
jgi:hypothetical protein